jgi:ferredoxin--NADP+ reductase
LDVARVLTKDPADLSHTDVPEDVLATLRRSSVTDVHLIARRAPQFAKFTSKELKELGELNNVDVIIDAGQLAGSPEGLAPNEKRNLAVLSDWSRREAQGRARRVHFHFRVVPRAVLGDTHVNALRLERADDNGRGYGEYVELSVDLILRSVGYRAVAVPGVPFDDLTGTIPVVDHRVVRDGVAEAGEYAVGWIKRGPTGILGTNRKDASETVTALLADSAALLGRRTDEPAGVEHLLAQRRIPHVDLRRWVAIVEAESTHGMSHRPGPVKLAEWDGLLRAADRVQTQDIP